MEQVQGVSYIDQIFPNIVHICLAHHNLGFRRGIELCENLFEVFDKFSAQPTPPYVEYFEQFDSDASEAIKSELEEAGALDELRSAFTPLTHWMPTWPLGFLGADDVPDERALSQLEGCVAQYSNRRGHATAVALAMMMYWQGVSGKLKFVNGVEPPDLNALIAEPESEEGKMAAASVRAFSMAFFSGFGDEIESDWCESFWWKAQQLGACRSFDE